jgi:hypothetical protein
VSLQNLFEANSWFFTAHLIHIVALEIAAYLILLYFGTGWIPFLASVLCLSISAVSVMCYFVRVK